MCDKKYIQRFHYWQILLTCYFVAVFLKKVLKTIVFWGTVSILKP